MTEPPSMSDAAVKARTGKTWPEWFAVLDASGARKMDHKQIVALLSGKHGLGSWWRQMVTVSYEQSRGLRAKHQKPAGFEISRSKTINASADRLHKMFADARQRKRWLADPAITVRTSAPPKSLRATWVDGASSVEATFYPKAEARTQVVVQHSKLPDAKAAEAMKAYWGAQLERLCELMNR